VATKFIFIKVFLKVKHKIQVWQFSVSNF